MVNYFNAEWFPERYWQTEIPRVRGRGKVYLTRRYHHHNDSALRGDAVKAI